MKFDSPDQMKAFSARMRERAVTQKSMPLGNKTNMTEDERNVLAAWIEQGAVTQ